MRCSMHRDDVAVREQILQLLADALLIVALQTQRCITLEGGDLALELGALGIEDGDLRLDGRAAGS